MKKGIVSLLAVTTVLMGTGAVSAESLEEALAAAYESNPQLMAQRAALRATDEGVSQANSGFLPNLSGTYTYSERKGTQGSGSVVDTIDTQSDTYQLSLSQNLFNGFQDRHALRGAKNSVMAGRAQLQSVEQQVLLDAVTAYMNVLRDEAVVDLNKNNVQVLERQLQASQDRFRVGEVTRTDVAQSEARLEGAKSSLLTAEATLAASRAQYRRVVGHTPAGLDTPTGQPALPASLDEAIEIAMEMSPGVIAARYNEKAANESVKQARGALLPSVDAFARWDKSTTDGNAAFTLSQSDETRIGVQVSVPIFQGGARYSSVRRAKQTRSQRLMDIRQAERVAQENVFVAWDQYRAAVGQIKSTEAQVRASEIALEGVRQEAYVGSRTTLDVLNAEQELLNARVALVRAQRDEAVTAYSLVSAVGKLTAKDLRLGVAAYNPERYYDKVDTKFIGTDIE
ncbi:TolC family outer membrane protein [Kordiimonas lacus]|uniref:Outer membrane protein n=1 Tax=Kordiimonas lacus TaxID=637679 RepID=A0A1G6VNY4_9PROT|nr:TolC family outer membrane protein [Kordiimonas lacus]SDD55123.1 outer membrane protein [Kordiimonas lacus]